MSLWDVINLFTMYVDQREIITLYFIISLANKPLLRHYGK